MDGGQAIDFARMFAQKPRFPAQPLGEARPILDDGRTAREVAASW